MDMGDKNPKHPLKQKKVVEKVEANRNEGGATNATAKSKKHA